MLNDIRLFSCNELFQLDNKYINYNLRKKVLFIITFLLLYY